MDQISNSNYDNYKLDTKGANKLAWDLHKNLMEPGFVDNIIKTIGLDLLLKTRNSGLISNIINYFVETANTQMINQIEKKIGNFKLMKRDYMCLIKYFYVRDYPRAQMYWETNILGVKTNANTSILQLKDINFILENKLHKLLGYLSGLFVVSDYTSSACMISPNSQFKKFTIKPELQSYLITQLENYMGNYVKVANSFYSSQMKNQTVIIDAGNVLHGRNGKVTHESIQDLFNIIDLTRKTLGEPIVVIHKRHGKSYPVLIDMFIKSNVKYFQTPYNFNDDIFIMWFFAKSAGTLNILSNDKYRDHIYNYQSSAKSDDFFISEFANVLTEQTLSYQLGTLEIQQALSYSFCIQVIGSNVYVPHISGKFIQVSTE